MKPVTAMVTHKPREAAIPLPLEEIGEICRRYDVTELSVFGSVLREDFGPNSDVDFLVAFRDNDAGPWSVKFLDMSEELSALLGHPVDIVDKKGIEASRNPFRRRSILESAEVIYAA